jgi:hypothetical protein
MLGNKNILIALSLLLVKVLVPYVSSAQQSRDSSHVEQRMRYGVSVDFRVCSTTIDSMYHNNAQALERIDSLHNALAHDTLVDIVAVEFCGTASPEGSAIVNHRISHDRMLALETIVRERFDIPQDVVAEVDHYIAWDRLIAMVEGDEALQHRDAVLKILRSDYPTSRDRWGREVDGRIAELKRLDGGRVWVTLYKRYFDQMRNAWFIMVTTRRVAPEPESLPEPEPEVVAEIDIEEEPEPEVIVESQTEMRVPLVVVKSNALEVAALIINLGAEFRLTPRLSLDVIGHYSPYDYFRYDRKVRLFAIEPELRYWFGEPLIKGHFVGLHIPVVGFNIQLGDKERYQDPNRAAWGVGLSYGYAMPLGRDSRWGVEFTLGVGYLNVVYDVYEGVCNGKYLETRRMNYFGPTRIGIDFSYRFDYNKRNNQKKRFVE